MVARGSPPISNSLNLGQAVSIVRAAGTMRMRKEREDAGPDA